MNESTTRVFLIIAVALLLGASLVTFSIDMKISANSTPLRSTSTQTSSSYSNSSTVGSQTGSSSSLTSNTESQNTSVSASTILASITSASFSTSTSTFISSITFSSPTTAEQFMPGQTITISGTIIPSPKLPDNVLIELSLSGQSDLEATTVSVQTDGTFSSEMAIGESWPVGIYTISVTDSHGTTGVMTTTVYNQMY